MSGKLVILITVLMVAVECLPTATPTPPRCLKLTEILQHLHVLRDRSVKLVKSECKDMLPYNPIGYVQIISTHDKKKMIEQTMMSSKQYLDIFSKIPDKKMKHKLAQTEQTLVNVHDSALTSLCGVWVSTTGATTTWQDYLLAYRKYLKSSQNSSGAKISQNLKKFSQYAACNLLKSLENQVNNLIYAFQKSKLLPTMSKTGRKANDAKSNPT